MSIKTYLDKDKCEKINKLADREQARERSNKLEISNSSPVYAQWTKQRYNFFMTEAELDEMADEYVDWAIHTDSVRPYTFATEKGVDPETLLKWCGNSKKLENAHRTVMSIFAERRERKGLEGTWNSGMIMATMPLYCPSYANWRKEMSAAKGAENATVKVQIETMPTTSIVAHKGFEGTDD